MKSIIRQFMMGLLAALCCGTFVYGNAFAADFDPGQHLITVITPSHANPFFKTEAVAAVKEAHKLGYKTNSVSHSGSPSKQLQQIKNAIAQGSSAIVLDNAGAKASIAAVKKARDAGIPVFLIDREIDANGIANAQIVSNNFQCATSVARYFAKNAGYKGNWVELVGLPTDTNAQVRSKGFHSIMDEITSMKMVARQAADWKQTKAYNVMQSIIQAHPKIVGVLSGNDTMALGAAAALQNAGMTNVHVYSIDGNPHAVAQIKNGGIIRATALQQASKMAQMAVIQINKLLRTGKTGKPEKQSVNCVLITKKNADQVLPGGFGMKAK